MDRRLGSSGSYGGGGGVVSSGGSATGPISTVSKEDELVLSSEVSSSFSEESEVELGLGLSLGCGGAASKLKTAQYARIFTAEDLPSLASRMSSSSSSTSGDKANSTICGSKRSADSFSSPRSSGVSRVVGWPPVRASRMNSLVNQAKSPVSDDCNSTHARSKVKSIVPDKTERSKKDESARCPKTSLFVKVNMDGMPIGRKVDLGAHTCYETLVHTLDDMFCKPGMTVNARSSYSEEDGAITDPSHPTGSLMLLDESSEYALTYEDKDGDWMLVGDVPWEMFTISVKRLRIMKRSEANGLAPRSPEPNERGRTKHI